MGWLPVCLHCTAAASLFNVIASRLRLSQYRLAVPMPSSCPLASYPFSRHSRSGRRRRYGSLPSHSAITLAFLGVTSLLAVGCSDDLQTARKIQAGRQARQQAETNIDHLTEAFGLVSRLVELNRESATRQITYHLNAWQEATHPSPAGSSEVAAPEALLKSISNVLPLPAAKEAITRPTFAAADIDHLHYRYLLRQVSEWVRTSGPTDPLWDQWLQQNRETLGAQHSEQLSDAIQLFDWTVRNVALEPLELGDPLPTQPRLPLGMRFMGPGYRQTPLQTLFRGTGDALQRSGTFIGLCRQAQLPACLLATAPSLQGGDHAGELAPRPWLVGVLIGGEIYLFDCALGVPVVGPNQSGIATLSQTRRDASILRRMNVPGWFDYPVQRDDVQQLVALLMLQPEGMSLRAQRLQQSLTGSLRMVVYDDPTELASQFEAVTGIARSEIWDMPLLAQIYQTAIKQASDQDPMLSFYVNAPWTILDADFDQAKRLALGRWRHLQGQFESNEDEDLQGAKKLYLSQRQPEFEIAELRTDLDLQMQYGIRRELGVSPEVYDRQIQQVQTIMRQGKVTATYWLSLIQYDTDRLDLAKTWFEERILGDGIESRWEVAARYNLARTLERLGELERAAELYRTEGDPQEHGNRIRARLIQRGQDATT